MKGMTTLLDTLQSSVAKSLEAIRAEAARMDAAAAAVTGGKIADITMCRVPDQLSRPLATFAESHMTFRPHWTRNVAAARELLAQARTDLEAQHAANLPLLDNNRQVTAQVKLIMANIGIPESRRSYGYATARARKMTTTTTRAGYLADLDAACKTTDMYAECVRKLDDFEQRITRYETEEKSKEQLELQAKAREKAERAGLTLLGALAHKYGCDADYDSLIAVLANRDKYFGLGYWLLRNRNSWSDGPDRAQRGLAYFTVETEEDRLVALDVQARIDAWSGDGRVFRDSPYGYDFLLAKADAGIMADFGKLEEAGLVPED